MLQDSYPYYLANQRCKPNTDLEVIDKYSGGLATRVALADEAAIDEAIARAIDAVRPMQDLPAGIFTKDIHKINNAWDTLEVGGIVVGDVPSWRPDQMPYGGIKDSGLGREGIQFAMEDMTEIRLMVMRHQKR